MQKKLNLWMDEALIARGKAYARRKGISLSRLVSDYLKQLTTEEKPGTDMEAPVSAFLRGFLRDAAINEDDYKQYLLEKHL